MRIISFQSFNFLLGLVVNVLTLGGFIFGVIELTPGWGPLSKPGPILVLSYLLIVILWLLYGFETIRLIKRRYDIGPHKTLRPTLQWKGAFKTAMYVVTLPTTVLWILGWIALLGVPGEDGYGNALVFIGGLTLFLGGNLAANVVMKIDWLFNPTHYTEQQQP